MSEVIVENRLPVELATDLTSRSQIARRCTESWSSEHIICPKCSGKLNLYVAGQKVYDLFCIKCPERFQLKSQSRPFGRRILGAAYHPTMRAIQCGFFPNLILLTYKRDTWTVQEIEILHRGFFSDSFCLARNPLSVFARRSGWLGCLFLLSEMNPAGRIRIMSNGKLCDPEMILKMWHEAESALESSTSWRIDVASCIAELPDTFNLNSVYAFEFLLASRHPGNKNIRAKIRQQLQVMRDAGCISFMSNGNYRRT